MSNCNNSLGVSPTGKRLKVHGLMTLFYWKGNSLVQVFMPFSLHNWFLKIFYMRTYKHMPSNSSNWMDLTNLTSWKVVIIICCTEKQPCNLTCNQRLTTSEKVNKRMTYESVNDCSSLRKKLWSRSWRMDKIGCAIPLHFPIFFNSILDFSTLLNGS